MPDYYGTVVGYEAYHLARGRTVTGTVEDLLIASEWLDGTYSRRFMGLKVGMRDQVREWPRTGVVDRYGHVVSSDTVPVEIENATYEAAYRADSLNVDFTPSKYQRVVITGSVDVTYRDQEAWEVQGQYPTIDQILDPLIGAYNALSGLSGKVVRA